MKASDWYYKVWQSFAVLLPVRSVGVMGDERTYENTIALRIVESQDGMTADWVRLPYDVLARISARTITRSLTQPAEMNGVYSAVWISPDHYETATAILAFYGITSAQRKSVA